MSRRGFGFVALALALMLVGCQSGGGYGGGNILGAMTQGVTGVNPSDVHGATTDIDDLTRLASHAQRVSIAAIGP